MAPRTTRLALKALFHLFIAATVRPIVITVATNTRLICAKLHAMFVMERALSLKY